MSKFQSSLKDKVVLGVSPLIGGKAVKGPAAKMYHEMGIQPSAAEVATHYGKVISGFVIDQEDEELISEIEQGGSGKIRAFCTDTWMKTREDRLRVAGQVMEFGQILIKEG